MCSTIFKRHNIGWKSRRAFVGEVRSYEFDFVDHSEVMANTITPCMRMDIIIPVSRSISHSLCALAELKRFSSILSSD